MGTARILFCAEVRLIISTARGRFSAEATSMTFCLAFSNDSMGIALMPGSEPGSEFCARRHDGSVALRTCGDHSNFNVEEIGNKAEVLPRSLRQPIGVAHTTRRRVPAWQSAIFRCDSGEILSYRWHLTQRAALVTVTSADLDFALRVKHIQFGYH